MYLFGLFNNNKVQITSILRGSDEVASHLAPFTASGFIVRRLKDTNNENTTLPNAETFKNTVTEVPQKLPASATQEPGKCMLPKKCVF